MDELEFGKATIVYEDQDGDIVEETVDNEMVVYARDHWMLKSGTDDEGNDLMSQIPRDRWCASTGTSKSSRTRPRRFVDASSRSRTTSAKTPRGRRRRTGGGPRRSGDRHEPQSQTIPVEEGDEGDGR